MMRTNYNSMRWYWSLLICTRPICLVNWIFIILKQHSIGRYLYQAEHIILITIQSVFALTPLMFVFIREAANTDSIDFGLTQPVLEPMIGIPCSCLLITKWRFTYHYIILIGASLKELFSFLTCTYMLVLLHFKREFLKTLCYEKKVSVLLVNNSTNINKTNSHL